ncbi:MAG: DUF2628 domain-containing protein [Alphaproteobacteria bacterium]
MVTYTVHEREDEAGDISKRAEKIVFVKEGFAWVALLIPFLWLLYHRMWLVLAGYISLMAAIQIGFAALDPGEAVAGWAALIVNSAFALLANDLRRWTLGLRGYHLAGPVSGRDLEECEERFFIDWLAEQGGREDDTSTPAPRPQHTVASPASPVTGGNETDGVIGLFPEPGK